MDPRIRSALTMILPGTLPANSTVYSIAGRVGLSTSRFAHLFAKQVGASPLETFNRVVMHQAASLLKKEPHLSVKEIAFSLGFSSLSLFSRPFRKQYGITPTGYRVAPPAVRTTIGVRDSAVECNCAPDPWPARETLHAIVWNFSADSRNR